MSADTGAPVRRAQVRISGPDIGSKTAMTDAEGRYEFRDLPGGRFTLSAIKSGFVTVQYGQTRPYESGKSIELVEAQVLDKADIAMPRGSVISGRVLDEFGEPVADAMVSAMRSAWTAGRRKLQPTGRIGADQRSRSVPHLRPASGRLLRQRHAARGRRHDDGHGDGGGHVRRRRRSRWLEDAIGIEPQLRICPDVLSRHRQRRGRAAADGRGRPGSAEHRFRAAAGAAREDHGDGDRLGRQAGRRDR